MISRILSSSKRNGNSIIWNYIYMPNKPNEAGLCKKIDDIIQAAIDKPNCTTCFEAVKATPIIKQAGLVFVTESVFTVPEFDSHWSPDKEFAEALRRGNTGTTADISWYGLHKGKRYIALTNVGINEKSDHFSVTLIHSLLHSGGKEGKNSQTWSEWWWGINPHDLRYLGKQYDDVLEACQNNKSKAGKAAGKGENEQQ